MCNWDGSSFLRNIVHITATFSHKASVVGLNGSSATDDDDVSLWCFASTMMGHLIGYVALLGVVIMVVSLVFKWISECGHNENDDHQDYSAAAAAALETAPLLPAKTVTYPYGTCSSQQEEDQKKNDIEAGDCSSREGDGNSNDSSLYDGKICVICYDEERGCFFVPCGHCATCYDCAVRIFHEDGGRMCPVCRRYIGKIRKLS